LSWDEALLLGMRRLHAPWGIRVMSFFTHLGDPTTWIALALIMLATGTALGVTFALRIGFASGAGLLLTQPIKRLARRARPQVAIDGFEPLVDLPDAFSFPSGHTAVAFSIAVVFVGAPFLLGPLLLAAAAIIGLSRVYLGAHYPLDVGAGMALGICAGFLGRVPADVYFPL
jgi:undecaprenyl-diphosphatase